MEENSDSDSSSDEDDKSSPKRKRLTRVKDTTEPLEGPAPKTKLSPAEQRRKNLATNVREFTQGVKEILLKQGIEIEDSLSAYESTGTGGANTKLIMSLAQTVKALVAAKAPSQSEPGPLNATGSVHEQVAIAFQKIGAARAFVEQAASLGTGLNEACKALNNIQNQLTR
jgi:hypothetical protein